jgi:hypothetical protein
MILDSFGSSFLHPVFPLLHDTNPKSVNYTLLPGTGENKNI